MAGYESVQFPPEPQYDAYADKMAGYESVQFPPETQYDAYADKMAGYQKEDDDNT